MRKAILLFVFAICLIGCSKNNLTVEEITKEFENNSLSVVDLKEMTTKDYGSAPFVGEEAWMFTVENDMNARIFKIKNSDDLQRLKSYYDELGKTSALFYSHTYSKGNFLIQMNGEIAEETFNKYTEVMNSIIK